MKYYILFYRTVDDYIEKRAPYRDEHLALARKAHEEGSLFLGGALDDPANGAVLVFRSEGPEAAREFARKDPYVKNGVVTSWEVRPWNVVIGND